MKLKKNIAISESGFIFNSERGDSFSANPIGQDILELLREGNEEPEIAKTLLEKYEIDAPTLEKDVYDFVKMLNQFNLLEE